MRTWLARGAGVFVTLGALLAGPLVWLVLLLLADLAKDPPYPPEEIPALVRTLVAHPTAAAFLALPAFACGVVLVHGPRRPLPWLILGSVAMLLPFGVAIACFIALIGPLYVYRPL